MTRAGAISRGWWRAGGAWAGAQAGRAVAISAWALHVLTIATGAQGQMTDTLPLFERALIVTESDPALTDLRVHCGEIAAARRDLEAAVPHAEKIGSQVIGSLALARSVDREYAGDPAGALALLTAGLAENAEDLDEIEDLLPETVRTRPASRFEPRPGARRARPKGRMNGQLRCDD